MQSMAMALLVIVVGWYCEVGDVGNVGDVGDIGDYNDGKIDKPVPPPCSRKSNPAASQSPPLPGPGKKCSKIFAGYNCSNCLKIFA